jgi:hypothetical protein
MYSLIVPSDMLAILVQASGLLISELSDGGKEWRERGATVREERRRL